MPGKYAKQAMGHNFVLLKSGVDIAEFASKANLARDN
jgi:azurin